MKKLNIRQEKFCQLYVKNEECFGNATKSYSIAFKKPIIDKKTSHTCEELGSRLLRKVEIDERITKLLLEQLNNEVVDKELTKLILQNNEPQVKVAAIREYNKLKARITERSEVKMELPQPIYSNKAIETVKTVN